MVCQRTELAEVQEQKERIQKEVIELKQKLKQQQDYCTSHHIYDTTSPLLTADMILESPASEADAAAAGLLDLVQQVRIIADECCFTSRDWYISQTLSDTAQRFSHVPVCTECGSGSPAQEGAGGAAAADDVRAGAAAAAGYRSA